MTTARRLLAHALPLASIMLVPVGQVVAQAPAPATPAVPAATSGPAGGTAKAAATGTPAPLVAKLPDEYVGRDTNRDGQIGLYEWSRKDIATFRRLDINRDGFLTAQELIASKQPSRIFSSNVYVPTSRGTATNVAQAKSGSAPAAGSPDSKSDAPKLFKSVGNSADVANDLIARAKRAFGDLDKDKDGMVSKEELSKSRVFGKRFNEAGIAITEPVSVEKFTTLFTQVMNRDS